MAAPKPTVPRETLPALVLVWPQEVQDANEVLGLGYLTADGRKRLAQAEVPFVITDATVRYFEKQDKYSLVLEIVVAPEGIHETPWQTSIMLGLPDEFDPNSKSEVQGDREKVYRYFQDHAQFDQLGEAIPPRPLGPCYFVMVATQQPEPYCAIRPAPEQVMARYALVPGMGH